MSPRGTEATLSRRSLLLRRDAYPRSQACRAGMLPLARRSPRAAGAEFLLELEDLLRADVAAGRETSRWQNAISRLRAGTLRVGGALGQERIEALFGQARVMIAETSQRGHAQRYLAAQRQADGLRELGQRLITAFDLHRLTDLLAEQLPAAGIRSAYLAVYREPAEPGHAPGCCWLLRRGGAQSWAQPGATCQPSELVPAELLPWWRRYSLVFGAAVCRRGATRFCAL